MGHERAPTAGPEAQKPPASRLGIIVRYEGLRGLAQRLLQKSLGRVVWVERLFFFDHPLETEPLPARVPVEFRVISPEDVDRFAGDLSDSGITPEEAHARLRRGDVGYFGILEGRLVHQAWDTTLDPYVDEVGLTLLLGPGEVCSYGAWTAPAWRGLGIQAASIRWRNARRLERGLRRHLSWIRADNVQNLRVHARLGTPRIQTLWAIRLVGLARPIVLGARRGPLRFERPM
jgi:hypothetical protein